MLFAGVYVCTFQSGNFTCWGSEGVKLSKAVASLLIVYNRHQEHEFHSLECYGIPSADS